MSYKKLTRPILERGFGLINTKRSNPLTAHYLGSTISVFDIESFLSPFVNTRLSIAFTCFFSKIIKTEWRWFHISFGYLEKFRILSAFLLEQRVCIKDTKTTGWIVSIMDSKMVTVCIHHAFVEFTTQVHIQELIPVAEN
eukprot:TRINITY_DN12125_c0_g1_i1.p1 TRINITY_DN12125_c0_g1~~TRINITY_DN12125_c0_g1_i1.p1  ORF type:complete len:140 (-),score=3.48 TRINITY_DN12125_c0_g1_i1:102-521(-)